MKKGMLQILVANIINLLLGLVTGFILPKYLSVDAYGYIKTYHLYITYIGFFHLGYADGMYLKYGGKDMRIIDTAELQKTISTLYVFQTFVMFIMLGVACIAKDWVLIAFSLTILPYNITGCYKSLYQAVGEFKKYGYLVNLSAIIPVLIIVIAMVFKRTSAIVYVGIYVFSYYIVFFVSEYITSKFYHKKKNIHFSTTEFITNIKSGILLMVGNFSSLIMSGMDRWCVKLMMKNMEEFSYYSFAVSMQGMLDVFISPFTITMYNYVCKGVSDEKLKKLKEYCLVFGLVLVGSAFPIKFIIEIFLQQYKNACGVMFFLFATEILYLVIKGIYINLYKARGEQDIYFKQLVLVCFIAMFLNIICYYFYPHRESFAFATFASTVIWFLLCSVRFREIKFSIIDIFIMFSSVLVYIFVGIRCSSYVGCGIYYMYILILLCCFKKKTLKELIDIVLRKKA